MKFGIALRLGLLLAVVGVLAAGVTGYYAYDVSRGLLVQSAKTELLTSTQVIARRMTLMREEVSRNLHVLATHPAALSSLQQPDHTAEDQLATLFRLMMEANPGYFQIRLISASDNGMERVRLDRDVNQLVRVTGDDLQEKGHFGYVFDTLRLPAGSTYLSRIVINHERGAHAGLGQPTVQLATPIVDQQERSLGLVLISVDLNGLFALLAKDIPTEFQLFLTNSKGDYLIHPDSSQTFGFDKGRRVLIQDEFAATQDLVTGKVREVLLEASSGRYAETPVLAAFLRLKASGASDDSSFIIGLAQPLAAVLEKTDRLGAATLQIVGALCLICILVAALVARAVTRPINAMSVAMQRFANERQLADDLPVERQDEIGALASSFKLMQTEISQHLAQMQNSRTRLEHLVQHDVLTGLPNRRLFQDRLEHALVRARRNNQRVALLFIDLDHFKAINDRLGHDVGDAVLKAVASRLAAAVREVDTVARLGGDEFVILLDDPTHREHVAEIAEKLMEALKPEILFGDHALRVSVSIGISQYPDDGDTASGILANADRAMYRAKTAGRSGFHFFSAVTPKPGTFPV
jgi:diguanylate cyclase (GGDEF)-like protein